MCIEYHIQVNMYHLSTHGIDERMINVHYYYYYYYNAQGVDERMISIHYYYYYCMDWSNTSIHEEKVCLSLCTAKYPGPAV